MSECHGLTLHLSSTSTTGYKYVSGPRPHNSEKPYHAQIPLEVTVKDDKRRNANLGYFRTAVEAAEVVAKFLAGDTSVVRPRRHPDACLRTVKAQLSCPTCGRFIPAGDIQVHADMCAEANESRAISEEFSPLCEWVNIDGFAFRCQPSGTQTLMSAAAAAAAAAAATAAAPSMSLLVSEPAVLLSALSQVQDSGINDSCDHREHEESEYKEEEDDDDDESDGGEWSEPKRKRTRQRSISAPRSSAPQTSAPRRKSGTARQSTPRKDSAFPPGQSWHGKLLGTDMIYLKGPGVRCYLGVRSNGQVITSLQVVGTKGKMALGEARYKRVPGIHKSEDPDLDMSGVEALRLAEVEGLHLQKPLYDTAGGTGYRGVFFEAKFAKSEHPYKAMLSVRTGRISAKKAKYQNVNLGRFASKEAAALACSRELRNRGLD